ncbi:hypothetical protein, partial [Aeromonas caviae]|uniref:hypothetical protein n=1 Tax=Aeromonas caviae TaxID=648 RepID=UPI001FBA2CC1
YDARRQQGDGGGVFGDSQFTSTLSVNFHFPKIPRRTLFCEIHHQKMCPGLRKTRMSEDLRSALADIIG